MLTILLDHNMSYCVHSLILYLLWFTCQIIANNLFAVTSNMQALDRVQLGPDDQTQLTRQPNHWSTPLWRHAADKVCSCIINTCLFYNYLVCTT